MCYANFTELYPSSYWFWLGFRVSLTLSTQGLILFIISGVSCSLYIHSTMYNPILVLSLPRSTCPRPLHKYTQHNVQPYTCTLSAKTCVSTSIT